MEVFTELETALDRDENDSEFPIFISEFPLMLEVVVMQETDGEAVDVESIVLGDSKSWSLLITLSLWL